MKALLLVAHGSRSKKSNDEVIDIATKLKEYCKGEYNIVRPAFLELAAPLIPEGIQYCINQGATSITVLPYFLNSGRHVLEDIPSIINEAKEHYPATTITLTAHLGASDMMMDILVSTATAAA